MPSTWVPYSFDEPLGPCSDLNAQLTWWEPDQYRAWVISFATSCQTLLALSPGWAKNWININCRRVLNSKTSKQSLQELKAKMVTLLELALLSSQTNYLWTQTRATSISDFPPAKAALMTTSTSMTILILSSFALIRAVFLLLAYLIRLSA